MGDITKGTNFSGTSPNNAVTAARLNALVDSAVIQTAFFTGKVEETSAADADVFLFYDASEGVFKKIAKSNLITAASTRSGARGLVMGSNATNPQTQVDVTAAEICLRSAAGNARLAASFAATVDITVYSGGPTANGRDFASETASTWYYVWAISDGTNDRLLLSASATSPTLPTGYVYSALLGAVFNHSGSNLTYFSQRGNRVMLSLTGGSANVRPKTGGVDFTGQLVAAANEWQTVDLAKCIPPNIVAEVHGVIGQASATNTFGIALASMAVPGVGITTSLEAVQGLHVFLMDPIAVWTLAADVGAMYTAAEFSLGIKNSQTLYWTAQSGAAGRTVTMRVTGFTLNL
jgi:hypothetical protein